MDKEISSTMSSLLKTDKCSPLIVYIVFVIISGITLFNTNGLMKKLQNHKINNIFTMHAWYEVALLLVLGVVLFGLCQYNQQTLAWIVLFFPLALYVIKTLFIFNSVSSILRHVPPEMPQGIANMPLPQGGPSPPQNSNHATSVTPTQQQVEGVRHALDERKTTLQGQNSSMLQNLSPGGVQPFGGDMNGPLPY
tara:strand:- start:2303 stop:2884 length:582 start_codon:yes stop_codon:yes gene_type:complete